MHLKIHPEGVEFLRQFGLMFLFVLFGALSAMRWGLRRDMLRRHERERESLKDKE